MLKKIISALFILALIIPIYANSSDLNLNFIHAAERGDIVAVRTLVEKGANINSRDKDGRTALMLASLGGYIEIVDYLVDKDAAINAKDKKGLTTLSYAKKNGNTKLIVFLKSLSNICREHDDFLIKVAEIGDTEQVKQFLSFGADIDTQNMYGSTALMYAAKGGHYETVTYLISKGVDFNLQNHRGWTALMFAVVEGHVKIINALMAKGLDVNAKDMTGWTALMLASFAGEFEIVEMLLAKGADTSAKNKHGMTALMYAEIGRHPEIIQLFKLEGNNNYITLDESFATSGKAIANLRGKYRAKALVIQVDDKIVVGGSGGPNDGFVIGRYKKKGQIDTTFGTKGWLILPFGKGGVNSLSLQSDQKIIAVGSYKNNFAILRILPDGNPDKSFGFNGMSVTNLGGKDIAMTMGLQRDGKIVVAGSSDDKIVITRYHRTGKLDDTFGSSGVVQHRYSDHSGPIEGHPRTLIIQHNEKIILVGYMGTGFLSGHMYFALWRYNQSGKLDITFGDGGVVLAQASTKNIGTNIAFAGGLQKDNKIVIAGTAGAAFVIARFLPNGEYDKSFGNSNGLAKIHFGVRHEIANAVFIQSNGYIIGGGGGGVKHDFALARLLPDGTPDSTFGVDGKITIDLGGVDLATAMDFQSDGKLVVFGNSDDKFALVRLSE